MEWGGGGKGESLQVEAFESESRESKRQCYKSHTSDQHALSGLRPKLTTTDI